MKHLYLAIVLCFTTFFIQAQTPIVMSNQPAYSYKETFADINNWVFNTNLNGTFSSGVGSTCFKGIDATTTTPAIPNGARITHLSNFWQTPGSTGGVPIYSSGVYKGTQSITMLSTGASDNTSSIAFDMFFDFTSVNAGTLSYDYVSMNNNSGNRAGSLRVYASNDGVTFTEVVGASVLNFINFSPVGGSVANIQLPSFLNGSATARLRFYYNNGIGGTAGSRPRINMDNIKVTALPTTPCVPPTAQPTALNFTTVLHNQVVLGFTAAVSAPQNYLIVMSKNPALSSLPVNNTNYNIGDNLGDGTVVAITNNTTATITNLNTSTKYYFFIFSMNNVCSGGPLYVTTTPLEGNTTTLAGPLPCVAPTAQATNLTFTNTTTTSISGTFTPSATASEYVIIRTTAANFTGTLNNGTNYSGGNFLGNGSVVTRTAGNVFIANNLTSGVTYYFWVFALNNNSCNGGPVYLTANPLTANVSTVALPPCALPTSQPSALNFNANNTFVQAYFKAGANCDGYLVLRNSTNSLTALPTNGAGYTIGSTLGTATVVANHAATGFTDYNLMPSTTYYYFVFARNANCAGGAPFYLTTNPLVEMVTTTAVATNKFYFGNLHAHSSYSDGNKDDLTLKPSDNYTYAKNSLCMDFLGISDHNHSLAGMQLSNFGLGVNQAAAATTANFLALYGMEYGVISNGGHVLIYGTNNLIGWENSNYNIYVPISDYLGTQETTGTTGLFRTINTLNGSNGNIFASLAHPDFADYNNLANITYSALADSAIASCAVASGPAFSTSTNYNDPPTSFAYVDYYLKLLSKGYHLGPLMDHDTHYTNFGRSNNNRLGVVAPNLTSSDFFAAIKNRSFYASEDCDTKVNFSINENAMGTVNKSPNTPTINVYAADPTSPASIPTIKLMYGIAGSNILPVQIASINSYTLTYTDNLLANDVNAYYYADIFIAGNRTMSAPIWYNKTAPLASNIFNLNASLKNNRTVLLQTTISEVSNIEFLIEKSIDGFNYFNVTKLQTNFNKNIEWVDEKPTEGISYYRVKQKDKQGKWIFSNISSVNLNASHINSFSVVGNSFTNQMQLKINSKNATQASIIVTDVFGKTIQYQNVSLINGYQTKYLNTNNLIKGTYFISVVLKDEVLTEKVLRN